MLNNVILLKNTYTTFNNRKTGFGSVEETDNLLLDGMTVPKSNRFEDNVNRLRKLKNINFLTPMPIREGLIKLSRLQEVFCHSSALIKDKLNVMKTFSQHVERMPFLKDRKVFGILSNGTNFTAVDIGQNPETGNEEVLKLGRRPDYLYEMGRKFEPEFDMPVYHSGQVDEIFWNIQQKGENGASERQIKEIKQRIRDKGYEVFDMSYGDNQVKLYRKRPYLVDSECALTPFRQRKAPFTRPISVN